MVKNTLSSDRIFLRSFQETDADAIFAYRSLEDIAKYQYWEPYNYEDTLNFIKNNLNSDLSNKETWVGLAIIDKSYQKLIGDCAIRINKNDAEIGCNISPEYQKFRYAKEALSLLIDYCFKNNAIDEIFGITDSGNTASIRLMQSMQMVKSDEFEEQIVCKGCISIEHKYFIKRSRYILI